MLGFFFLNKNLKQMVSFKTNIYSPDIFFHLHVYIFKYRLYAETLAMSR